jgi:signal transduction histidine kinase
VRALAEAMGGAVAFRSEPGNGLQVEVALPMVEPGT